MNFQLKSVLFLLFSVAIFGSSCKKDEDNQPTNHLIYNGTEYGLSTGYLGEETFDCANVFVTLHDDDISLTDDGDLVGSGNVVSLALNSSTTDELESGTYNYSEEPTALSHCGGFFFFNWDSIIQLGTDFPVITGGTIKVEKSNGETAITFDLDLENGEAISGYFKGRLLDLEF